MEPKSYKLYITIGLFYLVTYALTGLLFGVTVLFGITDISNPFYELPQLGPAIATILFLLYQRKNVVHFLREGFTPGKNIAAYSVLLVPMILIPIIAIYYQNVNGVSTMRTLSPGLLVILIIETFVGAAGEEIGWRGYVLPRLQSRFTPLVSTLILGVIWGFWHVSQMMQGPAYFAIFFVNILALAVFLTFLYNKTGGSLLAVTLLHFAVNMMATLFLYPLDVHILTIWAFSIAVCAVILLLWQWKAFSTPEGPARTPDQGIESSHGSG
jgi:membrane protease YdiL (CAAX protease family)